MLQVLSRFILATIAGLAACLAGCQRGYERLPETGATLEGAVTYGKEKVTAALIVIHGTDAMATGFVGEDGRYKIANVPLGEVHIAVNTDAGKGQMTGQIMAQSQGKPKGPLPKMISLPAKYADPSTSGLSTTIRKGTNTIDIVVPK